MEVTSDKANFWKCSGLIVEIGGETFRKVIERAMDERDETFVEYLTNNCCKIFHLLHVDADKTCMDCCKVRKDTQIKSKKLLRRKDYEKLFCINRSCGKKILHCCGWKALPDALYSIDITLGYLLISNLDDLNGLPGVRLDYLKKIRNMRNEIFAHATALRMPKEDFDRVWDEATVAIKNASYFCDKGGRTVIANEIENLEKCDYSVLHRNVDVTIVKLKKLASLVSCRKTSSIDECEEYPDIKRKQKDVSAAFEQLTEDIRQSIQHKVQLVLVGFTKTGISSTTSSITGDKTFQGNVCDRSTTTCDVYVMHIGRTELHVVDTPGFLELHSDISTLEDVKRFTKDGKITVLAFVLPLLPPLTSVENKAEKLLKMFAEDQPLSENQKRFIIFTFHDVSYSLDTVKGLPKSSPLTRLLSACDNHGVGIDNKNPNTVACDAYRIIEMTYTLHNSVIAKESVNMFCFIHNMLPYLDKAAIYRRKSPCLIWPDIYDSHLHQ